MKYCPKCNSALESCNQGLFCFECGWEEWRVHGQGTLANRLRQWFSPACERREPVDVPPEPVAYLCAAGAQITFGPRTWLSLTSERYVSPQVGTTVVYGLLSLQCDIQTLDGTCYHVGPPRRDLGHPDQAIYTVARLPEKRAVLDLYMLPGGQCPSLPLLRYATAWGDRQYVFRQVERGRHAFDLWDGAETRQLVRREQRNEPAPSYQVIVPVPALLMLLLPWLDSDP